MLTLKPFLLELFTFLQGYFPHRFAAYPGFLFQLSWFCQQTEGDQPLHIKKMPFLWWFLFGSYVFKLLHLIYNVQVVPAAALKAWNLLPLLLLHLLLAVSVFLWQRNVAN